MSECLSVQRSVESGHQQITPLSRVISATSYPCASPSNKKYLRTSKLAECPLIAPSFSDLHDYVDTNEYGGFCENALADALIKHFGGSDRNEGMPDAMIEFLNNCQNAIDLWLKNNGIAQFTGTTMKKEM